MGTNGKLKEAIPPAPKKIGGLNFRSNQRAVLEYYYSELPAELLREAIDLVTRAGGAVMFGLTRDGGAFSIMVLYNEEKSRDYPHGPEEAVNTLAGIVAAFTEE